MIEAVMLAALGFLSASLLALMVAPAFWSRALRLATTRMRNSLPVSEAEFRADKDLMRADFAVRVHQLVKDIERYKLNGHRQFIEINRRDAEIVRLMDESNRLAADLAENRNARSVLEQTVNDRLPRLEHRLIDARQLIGARDQEIASLSVVSNRQLEALEEARAIGLQQISEIDRLKSALAAFQSRDRRRFADGGAEQEFALRGELDRMRALARQQASHIERLAGDLAVLKAAPPAAAVGNNAPLAQRIGGEVSELSILRARLREQAAEIERLKMASAGAAAAPEPAGAAAGTTGVSEALRVKTLEATIKRLEQTIAELSAEQQRAAPPTGGQRPANGVAEAADGKAAAGAVRNRFQTAVKGGDDSAVARLKVELAAANDRAARQAAYFMDEMRRLGTGRSKVPELPAKAPLVRPGRRLAQRIEMPAKVANADIAAKLEAEADLQLAAASAMRERSADLAAAAVPAPVAAVQGVADRASGSNVLSMDRSADPQLAMHAPEKPFLDDADILVMPGDRQRPSPTAIELSVAAANEAADAELEDLSRRKRLLDRLKTYDER